MNNTLPDNTFDLLLNKQVCCYKSGDKPILDTAALGFLQIMYPTFKIVKSEFDIYPDEPFIYIGDQKWISKIQKHTEPHIIIATTGEYNLTERETIISLVFTRHNKKVPQYLAELVKDWDDKTFYYNMKCVWLLGTISDRELKKNDLFINILKNIDSPFNLSKEYLQGVDRIGDEALKYLESSLIKFILKSREPSDENTKKVGMFMTQQKFYNQCNRNVPDAVYNLLESPITNKELKYLNFLLDLTWANR